MFWHNTLQLDTEGILPVINYEAVFDLLTNIPKFFEPFVNENTLRIFNKYINKYQIKNEALFNSSRGENTIF